MKRAFWVFESGETAVIVAGDEEAQCGAELCEMTGKAATFAVKRGHIAAPFGVGALDGVGLLFSGCDIMASGAFSLSVNQFAVGRKTIAVELMHMGHQRKHRVYQRLHRFEGAFFNHIPS